MPVRTRVAPSPTGDPHVGTGFQALFNYCLARKHGGQFILRIEDTDQVRSTRAFEENILRALRWLGLEWDEGPEVGGPHGPYRQSERAAIYREHAKILLDAGHAFRCFHTPGELAEMRGASSGGQRRGFDSAYATMDAAESDDRAASGEAHVLRMRVPREGTCVVRDHLRGEIEIEWAQVDQQVLMKSDGLPTYHLANVVDDHLMRITHVLRGEEWISSAPKHVLLYDYFGWEMPQLCHTPLLRNPDKSKLSKRKNPTSITYYERMGYLPEAVLNYLGRMAWSMPDEAEKFSLEEMVEAFDLDRVSTTGPVFDVQKLSWLNGVYIRGLDDAAFADRVRRWALNDAYTSGIIPLVRERVDRLSDLAPLVAFFFAGDLALDEALFESSRVERDDVRRTLAWGMWQLDAQPTWDAAAIQATLRETANLMELKLRDFLAPYFVAISGSKSSTPLFDTMAVLGRDLSRARIRNALELLGAPSKKEDKRWRRDLDTARAAAAERQR